MSDPVIDALTVDEMIAELQRVRKAVGGTAPVTMLGAAPCIGVTTEQFARWPRRCAVLLRGSWATYDR